MTRWNDARRRNRLGCQSHSEKTLCMTGSPPLKRQLTELCLIQPQAFRFAT